MVVCFRLAGGNQLCDNMDEMHCCVVEIVTQKARIGNMEKLRMQPLDSVFFLQKFLSILQKYFVISEIYFVFKK